MFLGINHKKIQYNSLLHNLEDVIGNNNFFYMRNMYSLAKKMNLEPTRFSARECPLITTHFRNSVLETIVLLYERAAAEILTKTPQ